MAGPTDPPDWVQRNTGKAREAFDRAQSPQEKPQQGIGSEQVAKSAPQMQPKPPSMARDSVDREAHAERLEQDRARAKQISDAIKERSQDDKSKEKDKER